MTDLDIKEAVRKRDGYKCQDCGMTQEEHQETVGTVLEVHRLIPGTQYSVGMCVTLCRACHDTKPSRTLHAIEGSPKAHEVWGNNPQDLSAFVQSNGVFAYYFSHYDETDRAFIGKITAQAMAEDRSVLQVFIEAIVGFLKSYKPTSQVYSFPSRLEFDAVDADQAYQTAGA